EIGDTAGEGTTLNNISQIYDARGDYTTALEYLEQSLAISREMRRLRSSMLKGLRSESFARAARAVPVRPPLPAHAPRVPAARAELPPPPARPQREPARRPWYGAAWRRRRRAAARRRAARPLAAHRHRCRSRRPRRGSCPRAPD
ncbi:MAG: tetratricopeptide repeat protein, partial [Bosea sp.]|nr:tetratricopeptide repeat protein [Bosea sp. (in: a-proteobacteria)]